jgi:hypothetical protein
MAELAESEALLAELNERIREATIAQDDKLTQDGIDAFDKVRPALRGTCIRSSISSF